MKYSKTIESKLIPFIKERDSDWTVEYDKDTNDITFGKYSPAGQDFSFTVDCGEDIGELSYNILNYYEDFDVSYETYIWLDNTGHGTNGAPWDMKDLYEDMKVCESYISDMHDIVSEFGEEFCD